MSASERATDLEATTEIDLSDELDRRRYGCPRGHVNWEPWDSYLWCASCARDCWDVDPQFDEILDKKTGETIPRARVRFIE